MSRRSLLWLQAGSCGGCTMAVLEEGGRGWFRALAAAGIDLIWHPSVSLETGEEVRDVLAAVESGARPLDILCVEGAVLCGPDGTGRFNRLAGTGRTMMEWVRALAPRAGVTVAIGSCAAFGGIAAADPDRPTRGACSGGNRPRAGPSAADIGPGAVCPWSTSRAARRIPAGSWRRWRRWPRTSSPGPISTPSGARASSRTISPTTAAAATNSTNTRRARNARRTAAA